MAAKAKKTADKDKELGTVQDKKAVVETVMARIERDCGKVQMTPLITRVLLSTNIILSILP